MRAYQKFYKDIMLKVAKMPEDEFKPFSRAVRDIYIRKQGISDQVYVTGDHMYFSGLCPAFARYQELRTKGKVNLLKIFESFEHLIRDVSGSYWFHTWDDRRGALQALKGACSKREASMSYEERIQDLMKSTDSEKVRDVLIQHFPELTDTTPVAWKGDFFLKKGQDALYQLITDGQGTFKVMNLKYQNEWSKAQPMSGFKFNDGTKKEQAYLTQYGLDKLCGTSATITIIPQQRIAEILEGAWRTK